ncbi:MAG: noncanonical pyrimidine nucleotidase, YjjG family [Bacteroidetes bacterium]|jgi:putative hydrolase of the HAD superfamily|nr:noncanonical pyrimidine nucleotidase, YjjG family [Bacteroidota bacterium]
MMKYRHIFFDLDNTLWDFDRNSHDTLVELYEKYNLSGLGVPSFEIFHEKYKERNAMMWEQYRLGKIDKAMLRDQRFSLTFWDMGLDAELAPKELPDEYLRLSPQRKHLFPHAHEVLSYLQDKYVLHIITNGFEEAQHIKLEASDLTKYFSEIIISEHTGFRKPDIRIFDYSSTRANAKPSECLMIGDGLDVDVIGAQEAGWDAIYFNPTMIPHDAKPTHEIRSLDELMSIL